MDLGVSDLFNIVKKTKGLSEGTAKFIFKKLLSAVSHCHNHNIAHCDIKLENIILDKKCKPMLIDFGLGHKIINYGYGNYEQNLGTFGYMAPEIQKSSVYDIKQGDYFALGVVLFMMVFGSPPFLEANECDTYYQMIVND